MYSVAGSFIPFPNIYWWLVSSAADKVYLDKAEHFQKMSYRNRYYITGANGLIQLSIPLQEGREQRRAMKDVAISYRENWQVQHWRTLVSVYNRTPFFQHYEPSLQKLFETRFDLLCDFNLASIQWLAKQLKVNAGITTTGEYVKDYGQGYTDLRAMKPGGEKTAITGSAPYYQVFNERNGFLPNLSMLDLLFAEGPHTMAWLKNSRETVMNWGNSKA